MTVKSVDQLDISQLDVIFSAVESEAARDIETKMAADLPVISTSSAYRYEDDVPILIPGINDEQMELLETQKEVRAEGLSGLERELQDLQDAYDLKLEMARKSGMDTTAITKQFEKQKTEVVQANMNEQLEAFSGLAGALSSLAGENKALAVASAVIDTYVGANKAFAQGGTVGFVTGAAVIAAGLNNVRTIMATDVPSSGGGGGGSAPAPPAPQMMSGAFDISGGVAPEATKAYVVTDEMSNSQNQLANIRRRATI